MAVQIECFSFLTTHIVVCESKVELLFSNSAFLIQKITQAELGSTYVISGAADRGRTDTVSLPLDFESSASANSTTAANSLIII